MLRNFVCFLCIICMLGFEGVNPEFFDGLNDNIKEDLFSIYTHVALTERKVVYEPITEDKVTFFLFTKQNRTNYIKIHPENPTPLDNKDVRFVFIIHGWLENRGKGWYEDLKNAFLDKKEEYYVVQVDWSEPALQGYLLSSQSTQDVGNIIAKFIVNLHNNYSIPLSNFLVVGHSLGGQISGFIGKKVQELTKQKLPRIVALDPAGPLFVFRPENERLNKNDAEVVHVIHTDGGTFGFLGKCGTIDFYPNGGSSQPGCITINLMDPTSVALPIMCDHQRSWKYFIEAVSKPNEFQGSKCNNWAAYKTKYLCDNEQIAMGNLDTKETGDYYLDTNNESPYYRLKSGLGRYFAILN